MQSIRINTTWDGAKLPTNQHTTLDLCLGPQHLTIDIRAPFYNDPPPPAPIGFTDNLWEHEVVELFIAGDDDRYIEIELGPFGHYLIYTFHTNRRRVGQAQLSNYKATIQGKSWRATASLATTDLPWAAKPLSINATAIHGQSPHRVYASQTALPGQTPDFHQPSHFTTLLTG